MASRNVIGTVSAIATPASVLAITPHIVGSTSAVVSVASSMVMSLNIFFDGDISAVAEPAAVSVFARLPVDIIGNCSAIAEISTSCEMRYPHMQIESDVTTVAEVASVERMLPLNTFETNSIAIAWPEFEVELLHDGEYSSVFLSDLAWPELSGSITAGDNYSASLMVSGSGVLLDATIDSATAILIIAPITLEASLLMGFVADLVMSSGSAGIDATLDIPIDASASIAVSGIALDASFLTGTSFSFSTTTAAVNLSTSYLLGSLFSADISTAGIKLSSGNLASDLIYGGSLVAFMPWLAVDLRLVGGGTTEVWLVNARTQGMAQYSNYPFQAFAMLSNGLLLAGAADGLYLTDSATDAGKEIAGIVEIGASDMGSGSVKYVPDAVLDCEGSGDLVLSVISDGGKIREYSTSIDHQGLQQNKRFKLAKGIKSRYWSARLSLPVGVSVTSLELKPVATRRTA